MAQGPVDAVASASRRDTPPPLQNTGSNRGTNTQLRSLRPRHSPPQLPANSGQPHQGGQTQDAEPPKRPVPNARAPHKCQDKEKAEARVKCRRRILDEELAPRFVDGMTEAFAGYKYQCKRDADGSLSKIETLGDIHEGTRNKVVTTVINWMQHEEDDHTLVRQMVLLKRKREQREACLKQVHH